MSAANRGVLAAKNQRARSYGLPLDLPSLIEPANPHLDFSSAHKRFSSRLDEFIRLTHAVVVAPGGIGTLLELMYVWQLLQLRTIDPRPTVLLGTEYWGGLLEWVKNAPVALRLADPRDLECVSLVDTPEEALAILDTAHADFLVNQRRGILAEADALTEAARIREATEELADDIARQMHLTEEGLAGWLVAA
jgi:predicted Rossmann-fold nucleotide-binding protein